jgi:hypothetical protein
MVEKESLVYKSGDAFLPKSVRTFLQSYWIGSDTSIFYITNWTFVHFLSGVFTTLGLLQVSSRPMIPWIALLLHTLWELWQVAIGMTKIQTLRAKVDVLVDTVSFMIGVGLVLVVSK